MPEASPIAAGTLEPLPALLALLRVAPEDRTGYDRSLFVHWIDADGNGCDTRHEVLIAQAVVAPSIGARCALSGGRWVSLYDGLTITDPAGLQIDHVVALAEAWDSGASAWSPAHREAYANDLGVPFALLAVSATTNQSKSDDDPADWLPPAAAAECPFLGDWIAVKVRWDLAVDPREHDALAADIRDCPATEMPYVPAGFADDQPGEPSAGPPPSAATSGGSCDPAYPTVCIPPPPPDLDCGDIGYRNFKVLPPDPHRFDGDHDGIGCET
ncbi:MAG: HNH endonuclease [Chloroflexi bacterium]|nr:HNH endonuclease [Chloroflexota bacterium]